MLAASDLMHRPVLDIETGHKVGQLNGILIDPTSRQIAAFAIDRGLFQGTKYVRWEDLQGIGPDAVTIPSQECLLDRRRVDPSHAFEDQLDGRQVFTASGQKIGVVADYRFDETQGILAGFDVRPSDAPHGLFGTPKSPDLFIPIAVVRTMGSDSLVVEDAAGDLLRGAPVASTQAATAQAATASPSAQETEI